MGQSSTNDASNNEVEVKKNLLGWKAAIGFIISIFLAGVISVITVTSYLDNRAQTMFYDRNSGLLLEQRVQVMEENLRSQNQKMDTIILQQNQLFLQNAVIIQKIENIK